jgi:hypothetical protein
MKKVIFGLAVLGSALMLNLSAKAQASLDPGEGGEKWTCCQVSTRKACQDMTGDAHYGTIRKTKC